MLRVQTLERSDRRPVVAEIAVVVVLHDHSGGAPGPFEQLPAPLGGVRDAGGELVGRGRDHGAHAGARQRSDGHPSVVERQRDRRQTGGREQRGVLRASGVLDSDRYGATLAQDETQQGRRLGHPRTHHQTLRIGHDTAAPAEQGRQRHAQFRQTARIRVTEGAVRQPVQDRPMGRAPGGPREEREVRGARPEVHLRATRTR